MVFPFRFSSIRRPRHISARRADVMTIIASGTRNERGVLLNAASHFQPALYGEAFFFTMAAGPHFRSHKKYSQEDAKNSCAGLKNA